MQKLKDEALKKSKGASEQNGHSPGARGRDISSCDGHSKGSKPRELTDVLVSELSRLPDDSPGSDGSQFGNVVSADETHQRCVDVSSKFLFDGAPEVLVKIIQRHCASYPPSKRSAGMSALSEKCSMRSRRPLQKQQQTR